MAPIATATPAAHSSTDTSSLRPAVSFSLENELRAALEHARRLTEIQGVGTPEVAVAWDVVEELQTASVRRRERQQSAFERYCVAYPDAPECRLYES